jgi:hypothetical protein
MTVGTLQSTIKEYRAQLLQRQQQAQFALERAYRQTLQSLQPALDNLYNQIEDVQSQGEEIPPSWLYEQKRLEAIQSLIQGQIDHFGALAQMQTGQMQHYAAQLGVQSGMAALDATVPTGVNWSFGVPSTKAIADLVGATQKGSPLNDLFQGFGAEAADGAKNALISGVTLGYNPRQIAPMVQGALDVPRYRALAISRTEGLRAYRSANLETFNANSDVVQGWIWQCDLSPRTCAACIAMQGTEHDLSEDMASHVNCRCVQIPKTKGWNDILGPLGIDTSDLEDTSPDIVDGSDWFANQDESTQRAILGNAKYEAWSNGDFTLSDVVGYNHDKQWGKSVYEKPLKELVNA